MMSNLPHGAFRITWIVENFYDNMFMKGRYIESPICVATTLDMTRWMLRLYPEGGKDKGYISCSLRGISAEGIKHQEIAVSYKIAIFGVNELPLASTTEESKTFSLSQLDDPQDHGYAWAKHMRNDEKHDSECCNISKVHNLAHWDSVNEKQEQYLPNLTLTLRCDIKSMASVPVVNCCTLRSRMHLERSVFTWTIKDFSSLRLNQKVSNTFSVALANTPTFQIDLFLSGCSIEESYVRIEVTKRGLSDVSKKYIWYPDLIVRYKISLLDSKGSLGKLVNGANVFCNNTEAKTLFNLPKFEKRSNLLAQKELHLRDDILLLQWECTFSNGNPVHLLSVLETIPIRCKINNSSDGTLMCTIEGLYREQRNFDLVIKVGEETFQAHKFILCSRSPVFSKMFTCDMSEKSTNQVDIVDFEHETIEMMLHFMYTDELEVDLGYHQVVQLYSIAAKYQIQALKEECCEILRSLVSELNVWGILHLGIAFNDEDLKEVGNSFICKFPRKVFESKAWKDAIENLPLLKVISPIEESLKARRTTSSSSPPRKKFKSNEDSDGSLKSSIKCLYEEQINCDLVVAVENKDLKAHKSILGSRSPVFRELFECEKNTDRVHIVDFKHETVDMFLYFMYSDELEVDLGYYQVTQLYSAAAKYQIPALKRKCYEILTALVSELNVWNILHLGILFNDEDLKEVGNAFICKFTRKVIQGQVWEDILKILPLPDVILLIEELVQTQDSSSSSSPVPKKFKRSTSSDKTLMSCVKLLYEAEGHCDLAIKVGSVIFNVHKFILCSRSVVFRRMFECEMSEEITNQVNIGDFKPETIRMMLRFMYTDDFEVDLDYSQTAQLYSVATKYQIQDLLEKCFLILRSLVSVSNVWDILHLGVALNDKDLKKVGKTFICNYPREVFECVAWEDTMGKLPVKLYRK